MQNRKLNPKKINNPFMRDKKKRIFKKQCILFVVILGFLLFLSIYLVFISNIFLIKNINIKNLDESKKGDIENIVKNQINSSKFIFFSQKNLVFFNKNDLIKSLDIFNFAKVKINKKILNTIEIDIEERKKAYIYKEPYKIYYLDEEANIISIHYLCQEKEEEDLNNSDTIEISLENESINEEEDGFYVENEEKKETLELENSLECVKSVDDFLKDQYFPVIENISFSRLDSNEKYVKISKEYLNFAKKLYNDLGIESDFRVKDFIIDESKDTIKVRLYNNILIFLSLKDDYDVQLQRFLVLRGEYGDELKSSEYIDIRYGDKIYYY